MANEIRRFVQDMYYTEHRHNDQTIQKSCQTQTQVYQRVLENEQDRSYQHFFLGRLRVPN